MQAHQGTADDETIARDCQYDGSSAASALLDEREGANKCKHVGLLQDVIAATSEVWQVQGSTLLRMSGS